MKKSYHKNQRKLGLKIGALGLTFALLLSGCAGSSAEHATMTKSMSNRANYDQVSYADNAKYEADAPEMYENGVEFAGTNMKADANTSAEQVSESAATTDRKLIRTINMDVETKTFDELIDSVETQVRNCRGYIEQSNIYNGNYNAGYRNSKPIRNANLTIRVPSDQMDFFLGQISGISNVTRKSESQDDVTLNYVDLKSHKEALMVEQKRLLDIMEKTQYVDELISLESRLSELRYQIESMESQLRTFDNKVDYATLYLNVTEVEELTPVEEETATQRMSRGFADSMKTVQEGLVDFGVGFVVNLPFIVIFLVVCFAFVMFIIGIVKFCLNADERKKKKALKKAKKAQKNAAKNQDQNGRDQIGQNQNDQNQ